MLKAPKRALISVSDKTDLIPFAKALHEGGVELLSTGGTHRSLKDAGIPVIEVANHTGFAEMMDGRVKTLHPKIHGGILGRRGLDDTVMAQHDIDPIDWVIVNLYPFATTIAKPDCTLSDAIENIDIGGPAMVRSAAKNHQDVAVIVKPSDYGWVLKQWQETGGLNLETRMQLACAAFEHTAAYDGMIANYLGSIKPDSQKTTIPEKTPFSTTLNRQWQLKEILRYGENPHQEAAFYTDPHSQAIGISTAQMLQGKTLSYNNIADTDAALDCVKSFEQPACVIVKHANPCGVALGENLLDAYKKAYQTDPISAFGGIIAFNRALDATTAKTILDRQFVEVIVAPDIEPTARKQLAKKPNIRVLATGYWSSPQREWQLKSVTGGLLVQGADTALLTRDLVTTVTDKQPTEHQLTDLLFAWSVCKFVKSNAIVYAKAEQTLGIGAGQMSRVYSAKIAGIKAADEGLSIAGSVMASDAFFPFRDGLDQAAEMGVEAVIQPGGSVRDAEVIAAANEKGIAMVFTGVRHFRH